MGIINKVAQGVNYKISIEYRYNFLIDCEDYRACRINRTTSNQPSNLKWSLVTKDNRMSVNLPLYF